MSSILSEEHIRACTFTNALIWGICRSHFHEVREQTQWKGRIIHLVLGVIEAIPVIGQIVSLIEMQVIQFFCMPKSSSPGEGLPEPTSVIPQVVVRAQKEESPSILLHWPQDLTLLGLTEAEMHMVDMHLKRAFSGKDMQTHKKKLSYTYENSAVDVVLPITLLCQKSGASVLVLLFPKTVFASGGERTIRWVYNLTKGCFYLKKRIVGIAEEEIITSLYNQRANRGISTEFTSRESFDKQGQPKKQIIESVRDGALPTLYGTKPLAMFSVKYDLIVDLLADLQLLHCTQLKIPSNRINLPAYGAFHSDIKPDNVLVCFQNGKWRGELCDFGTFTGHPLSVNVSIGYTSPEYISFYRTKFPFGIQLAALDQNNLEVANFIIRNGQKRDIWSLGLVILTILVGRTEEVLINSRQYGQQTLQVSPLPSLKHCLEQSLSSFYYEEDGITQLTQKQVDEDLKLIEKTTLKQYCQDQKQVKLLFCMINLMLKINPDDRRNVSSILFNLKSSQQSEASSSWFSFLRV